VDQGVGRLMEILNETGRVDDTLVLYLSDHGAAFAGAKTTVYEPGIRSPLIVREPGARPGVVNRAMISWVDITPTCLDWAGVSLPVWSKAEQAPLAARLPQESLHGRSFLAIIDEAHASGWDEVYASHTFHEITMYYPMRVVRERQYKLIWNLAHGLPYPFATDLWISSTWQQSMQVGMEALYGPRSVQDYLHRPKYELYDLQADPWESENLAADPKHAATLARLIEKLHAFQVESHDPWKVKQFYE
jgi:N-sulfoglucosamine sulfohydrolase